MALDFNEGAYDWGYEELRRKYRWIPYRRRTEINYIHIPATHFKAGVDEVKEFNRIMDIVNGLKGWHEIEWTKSGGISKAKGKFRCPARGVKRTKGSVEVVIVSFEGCWRFILGHLSSKAQEKGEEQNYGSNAFYTFKKELKDDGIRLEDYKISTEEAAERFGFVSGEHGEVTKTKFPKAMIKLEHERYKDRVWENAYHIDLNSSHLSGLAELHPEMRPTIERIYKKRKEDDGKWKAVLVMTFGYMQSALVNFEYTHLAAAMLERTNREVMRLAQEMKKKDITILAYNTDGIWAVGEEYHDEFEGTALGQWKIDHKHCKLRFKSAGSYEYEELMDDGKIEYHPVVRGCTRYEKIVPREEWVWGDIYRNDAQAISFAWDDKNWRVIEL